jgi:hypothetical protein
MKCKCTEIWSCIHWPRQSIKLERRGPANHHSWVCVFNLRTGTVFTRATGWNSIEPRYVTCVDSTSNNGLRNWWNEWHWKKHLNSRGFDPALLALCRALSWLIHLTTPISLWNISISDSYSTAPGINSRLESHLHCPSFSSLFLSPLRKIL